MKFINGWKSRRKQNDKLQMQFRVGSFTVLNLDIDISSRKWLISLFNFTLKSQ
jgi:hypothetical protein